MINKLKHNYSKFIIIGTIKGLAIELKKAKVLLSRQHSIPAQSNIMSRTSFLKYNTRHTLLAYAFLRGKTYKSAEANCSDQNKPNWAVIEKIILGYYPYVHIHTQVEIGKDIRSWLVGELK